MKPFSEPSVFHRTPIVRRIGPLLMMVAGFACSSPDLSGPSSLDRAHLPWVLTLNAHAITMDTAAPYNTLQLSAAPHTIDGTALANSVLPTFTSSDSSIRVSATGMLTARAEVYNVRVIATLVYGGVRISDTAVVNVTALGTPPKVQRLQLGLQPGDSAKIPAPNIFSVSFYGILGSKNLRIDVLDTMATLIPSVLVALRASDPQSLTFASSVSTARNVRATIVQESAFGVGNMWVYASANVYGVALSDSLMIQITDPVVKIFTIAKSTSANGLTRSFTIHPDTQIVGVGGWILWVNATSPADSLDVVFDDPTAALTDLKFSNTGGGNIAPFPGGTVLDHVTFTQVMRSRRFLQPGRFQFHSPRTGVSGTIIVR
jgi:hypothetical protein